jgi:photosystem II stability/assembly factor-like uncharacterized protein
MRIAPAFLVVTAAFAACSSYQPAITEGTWQPVITGSTASLRGIHAVSKDLVWATGNGGTVLRTTDAGLTWKTFNLGSGLDIRDVHAFDAQTAYVLVVTEPAGIHRTTDGGRSWNELYRSPHEEAFLDSFVFLDHDRIIVFGDPIDGKFLILTSEDGGESWSSSDSIPDAREGEGAFAASGTCVVSSGEHAWIGTGGLASRVLRSTNAGRTWEVTDSSMISGEPTTGIYSVAFRDADHGILVGGDYTNPENADRNAAFTTDGGVTWTNVPAESLPRGQRASVAWVPGRRDTLITVGRTGTDYSEDSGRTWAPLNDEGYYALSFAPTGEGWAVGADGRAARLAFGKPASE